MLVIFYLKLFLIANWILASRSMSLLIDFFALHQWSSKISLPQLTINYCIVLQQITQIFIAIFYSSTTNEDFFGVLLGYVFAKITFKLSLKNHIKTITNKIILATVHLLWEKILKFGSKSGCKTVNNSASLKHKNSKIFL